MRERLWREDGFTLPEVLVSMAMMALVLFALYAMFDAAVGVFSAGREEVEAGQDARLGLARMEREIRAAYPRDEANGDEILLSTLGRDRIAFGNDVGEDLGGNRRVVVPETGAYEAGEGITYAPNAGGLPVRNGVRFVESARDVNGDGRALTFEYLDEEGAPALDGDERDVALVEIRLEVSVGRAEGRPAERTLRTTVALRNR